MAEEIALGAWRISATSDESGALTIEVALEGSPRGTFVLPAEDEPDDPSVPRGHDMDF